MTEKQIQDAIAIWVAQWLRVVVITRAKLFPEWRGEDLDPKEIIKRGLKDL